MQWLFAVLGRISERRRIEREFARLRVELMEIDRRVAEQPWWGDLPPEGKRRKP